MTTTITTTKEHAFKILEEIALPELANNIVESVVFALDTPFANEWTEEYKKYLRMGYGVPAYGTAAFKSFVIKEDSDGSVTSLNHTADRENVWLDVTTEKGLTTIHVFQGDVAVIVNLVVKEIQHFDIDTVKCVIVKE